jgi:catechol 2,3-dioxygenase-like lactoylglutathione lyase family enzyme
MTLQHTSLEIRKDDVPAELSFWELLGFEHVEAPSGLGGRATWVARDGTHIHLLHADEPTVMPRGHVAILAEDYDATVARLRGAGFEFGPDEEFWGAPRGFVRTPAGHRVEVMAAPPPP